MWPPNPNKTPQTSIENNDSQSKQNSQAWQILETTLLASIKEQKSARRWNIFFKLLTFGYILLMLIIFGYGCGDNSNSLDRIGANQPHLAVVDVKGAIDESGDTNAENINKSLLQAFENEQAKAVVLNINSPGGSPVQSDEIWQMAMDLRKTHPNKKLYAVIGDVGASGAYYIASAADEIWVNSSSLVGSIGVILPSYNVEGLLGKVGVQDRTMTSGEHKNILSMTRSLSENEKTHVQNLLHTTHQNFIDAVKQGRGNKLKNPEENLLFTGLFWSGKQSVELGLSDKIGGMTQLKKSLDLPTVNYTYVNPMSKIFDRFGVQVGKGLGEGVKFELLQEPIGLQ